MCIDQPNDHLIDRPTDRRTDGATHRRYYVCYVPSLMMQESCNRGEGGASVSAADILAVGNNGNVAGSGKV